MRVSLIDAELPEFGVPTTQPRLDRSIYTARLEALMKARRAASIDSLLIYADREHSANLAWLTEFDPRFEEALLIVAPGEIPTLLAGPENLGRAQKSEIEVEARLYPPFGLLGQDRSHTPDLEEVLTSAGLAPGHRIGVLGWKYYGTSEAKHPESWFETPAFIIDTLRSIAGEQGKVVNANALLMDASTGLRAINEVDQIAQFEFGAVMAGEALISLFRNIEPGMSEYAAVQSMGLGTLPHSCHTMLSTGGRLVGLDSPSGRIIGRGDPLTTAVGYWGGLSSRLAWVVEDASQLPPSAADWLERLAMPYFACAAEWYSTIGIGVSGGALDAIARKHLGGPFFNLVLNPGHLLHIDEWMNTPVYPGSKETLKSGQMIQCDIIPAAGPPYYGANIEDGIALLDERGRAELKARHPQVASRIDARRAFMNDVLGIRLKPEVMPLSNLAAAYPPFLLSPNRLLALR
jgi:Xaa-Pro aminopeptidase